MIDLISPEIHKARKTLAEQRDRARALHDTGAEGPRVAAALSASVDELVTGRVRANLGGDAAKFESAMAVVALGGYGRCELAPFSDVDVMFLYRPEAKEAAEQLAAQIVRDLWDVGLSVGSSMRTIAQCLHLARADVTVHTALLDSRHLIGNAWITTELWEEIRRLTRGGRADAFVDAVLRSRTAEQKAFGGSAYLLEPDIKKSKGGLRDLHLLNWTARGRYRIESIERLEQIGLLVPETAEGLKAGRQFLLQVRNEMHFHAKKSQDVLTWEEQTRLASVFGFADRPGLLAVEQFMQRYYQHAAAIAEATDRFLRRMRRRSKWAGVLRPLLTQRVDGVFIVGGGEVTVQETAATLATLAGKLRPFEIAARRKLRIADEILDQLRAAEQSTEAEMKEARKDLLGILQHPGNLAIVLRQLRTVGLLEKLLPELARTRGLIQFNLLHKYSIDEHTLQCIAHADALTTAAGPVGEAYRAVRQKELLHLALLLHDLGKGQQEDHREIGRQIALATAERFSLPQAQTEMLEFLVHQHTTMSELAFRRDTSDPKLMARFARNVHTPELLRMLYVMTVCDISAIGPESWTSWKADVLTDFFARTMETLSGQPVALDRAAAAEQVRAALRQRLSGTFPSDWLEDRISAMPAAYLLTNSIGRIASHLEQLRNLPPGEVRTTADYDRATHTVAYTVYASEELTTGPFSKIAGALAAKGLHVLSAQISTHHDGQVVDRFEVVDRDFRAAPPAERAADVIASIRGVLLGEIAVRDMIRSNRRLGTGRAAAPALREDTQVHVDNDTSDAFTVLDVFATDRQGLLYVITRALDAMDLSVGLAKITTSVDQALDVFYVTDRQGRKITRDDRLREIRRRLVDAINAYTRTGEFPGEDQMR